LTRSPAIKRKSGFGESTVARKRRVRATDAGAASVSDASMNVNAFGAGADRRGKAILVSYGSESFRRF
jgi:hypothetical protein